MTQVEMAKRIAELEAALAVKSAPKTLTLKVSEKGGLSVYGLGRFPVTLYRDQWTRLLSESDKIQAFIKANEARLPVKD